MGYSRFDAAVQARAAWNAGKNVGTKRPSHKSRFGRSASISTAKGG